MSSEPSKEEREKLERRVEDLAGEIASLINAGSRGEERNTLKDLALSIVREEVRTGEDYPQPGEDGPKTTAPFNPIAIAIPVGLIGAVLLFPFPPMGAFLFGIAVLLVAWGLLASLFRRTPVSRSSR